jgi:glucose-1-phosphate adenylyltransferase
MNTADDLRIIEFEEKPEKPKSNLASMGIYIFTWKTMRKLLVEDMKNPESSHDFGKDIIPKMINGGKKLYAYEFSGYWKDVGTIDSLWEANMDLLDSNNELNLDDTSWKIYTQDTGIIPQYIASTAKIDSAYINQGAHIGGEVSRSVIFTNVKIAPGAKVIDSVLMPGAIVEEGAVITRALVAENVHIGKNVKLGNKNSEEILLVAKNVKGED